MLVFPYRHHCDKVALAVIAFASAVLVNAPLRYALVVNSDCAGNVAQGLQVAFNARRFQNRACDSSRRAYVPTLYAEVDAAF